MLPETCCFKQHVADKCNMLRNVARNMLPWCKRGLGGGDFRDRKTLAYVVLAAFFYMYAQR